MEVIYFIVRRKDKFERKREAHALFGSLTVSFYRVGYEVKCEGIRLIV